MIDVLETLHTGTFVEMKVCKRYIARRMRKVTAAVLVAIFAGVPAHYLIALDRCEVICCRLADPQCAVREASPVCPTVTEGRRGVWFVLPVTISQPSAKFLYHLNANGAVSSNLDAGDGPCFRPDGSSRSSASHHKPSLYLQHQSLLF